MLNKGLCIKERILMKREVEDQVIQSVQNKIDLNKILVLTTM